MDEHGFNPEHISTVKDLTSGTLGGMAGILIGQPLDRVKVLSQTSTLSTARPSTLSTLLLPRREGFFSLWKGVGGPIIGAAPLNALAFAGNGKALRYLSPSPSPSSSNTTPYTHYFLAGCVGGFTQTFAAVPAELIKCRLQVQLGHSTPSLPRNALTMTRHILHTEGLRGLYRGFAITCLRDTPSYGVYFLTYEWMKDRLIERGGEGVWPMLGGGAVAGAVSWLSCYPVDVVKSVVQTRKGEGRVGEVVRELWARGGWRAFFRGLSPTLIRSVPVNAVTFIVYEHSQLMWEKLWPT